MKLTDIDQFGRLAHAPAGNADIRVTLNKWPGSRDAGDFRGRLDDLGFACWNMKNRRRFRTGTVNLVFVQTEPGRFLFAAALKITRERENGACDYDDVTDEHDLTGFSRHLIVGDTRPTKTKMGTWCFKVDRLSDLVVESYDNAEWSPLVWEGYDKVSLSFDTLYGIIEGNRYAAYRAHLEDVCGVYILKDRVTRKLYVGSAYGKAGVAQRWNHYLETAHGGNKMLKRLFDEKGFGYFKENFSFTLVRDFPLGTDPKRVIAFESMTKELLDTRIDGYNAN